MKDQRNYQGLDPLEVGRAHQLVLGKHSGSQGLIRAYQDMGLELQSWQVPLLLQQVRLLATRNKKAPSAAELTDLLLALQSQLPLTAEGGLCQLHSIAG